MAIDFTDSNFEELVIKSGKPALVDFTAEWCGPCRMVTPIVNELAVEYEGRAVIGKKNGELADKIVGAVPKQKFTEKLESLI